MKIIILTIFLTIKGEYIDDQLSSLVSNLYTSTNTLIPTSIESSTNELNENSTDISIYENERWSLSSSDEISFPTISNEIFFKKEEWFNVNKSDLGYSSKIFWIKSSDESRYILRSDGECLRQTCYVKLKYNGSLLNKKGGCLSFVLWTHGQPIGQLWIEEDQQEEERFSQQIQLTNSTLRIEHSFKSHIENLSIDARILFPNPEIDRIILANLNIDFKGTCPKHRSKLPIIPRTLNDQSTTEDQLMTLTSEQFPLTSTLGISEEFDSTEENRNVGTSTIKFNLKESSSFVNQSNILPILSLIILFCLLIIFLSIFLGLWTIQGHYRFIWYIPYDYPIQFLARRSIRSSTRSEYQIKTLSQISNSLLQSNFQEENLDSFTTSSQRSSIAHLNQYF